MQIQDLVKLYQTKSDEELLRLAAAAEQLTSEAQLALKSELSRRQVSVAEHPDVPSIHEGCDSPGHLAAGNRFQREARGVSDFVSEVLRTYHSHFWLFFKITAPAVIISTIAIVTARNEGREITRHLPQGFDLLTYRVELFEIWLVNFSAYFVSWIASSFCFAAICIAVEETAAGFTPSAWNSLLNVRERLGPFLRLSLLLFVMALVAETAYGLLLAGVFWTFSQWHVHPSRSLIFVLSYGVAVLALLVFSRFGLAVPALILDDYRVGQATFRSDELTQGKWSILAALLAKSLIGGYVAAKCPFWLVSLLPLTIALPPWFPWILTCASIVGVTVAEPPMFVGFALLYLKMSASGSAPSQVLTSQLA